MSSRDASIATRRFGLGPRSGDIKRIANDPRGYVLSALTRADAAMIVDPRLETGAASFAEFQDSQFAEQIARQMASKAAALQTGSATSVSPPAGASAPAVPPAAATANRQTGAVPAPPRPAEVRRDIFQEEAAARMAHAVETDHPLLERLVMFWSNHFAISAIKSGGVRVMAGAFEREAIRPYVLGKFGDMLKAVEQHPAMLFYLDNQTSIGPDSQAGQRSGRGLNENLAREILELHTLGVDGGYSQADVTSFAKVITGWGVTDARMTVAMQARGSGRADIGPGQFAYFQQRHEPGEQTVLGKRYRDRGLATGEEVLADLARHPSTARHIARKIAAHFISQTPPAAVVESLEKTFRDSGGDLAAVARALVMAPESWQAPVKKVVPPYDLAIALMRGFNMRFQPPEALRIAAAIGQPLWQPPSPKGWPDDDDAWMGPSAVRERLRIAERVVQMIDRGADPRAEAQDLFGDGLSKETREAIARAEAREQGFELLIMSPEFLRR